MQNLIDSSMLIERGKALHRQGRLDDAADIYQQVLAADLDNADALHLLGVIANQQGDHGKAATLIGEALKRKPFAEHFHCNLGLALMGLGDKEGAKAQFIEELAKYPSSHSGHLNLGVLLQKQGNLEQAIDHYRAALALQPDQAVVLNNLGFAYMELCEFDEARKMAEKSLQVEAKNPEAFNLLGLLRQQEGSPEEALDLFERALALGPDTPEVHFNMGKAYWQLENSEKAVACYERALELGARTARVYNNLAKAYRDLNELDKAMEYSDLALEADSNEPDIHYTRCALLLSNGQFESGWKEYEWGLAYGERRLRSRELPIWDGGELAGKTLLVSAEQGLGDEIMFASILPEIIEQAGHCVIECDDKLVPIYKRSFSSATVLRREKPGQANCSPGLPHIDLQIPIGSLAFYRRNRWGDFPRYAGYLKANQERVTYWKGRLDEVGNGLKVGISWRGGTIATRMSRRSIPLSDWLPILKKDGARFISLQYTACHEEIQALEQEYGIKVEHWQEAIDDYDETAALVCALDLVISVQTAIVHLSGALGRPAWVMLPIPAEWRYLNEGEFMPWYPSVRLFRQRQRGQWQSVIDDVAQELASLSTSRAK